MSGTVLEFSITPRSKISHFFGTFSQIDPSHSNKQIFNQVVYTLDVTKSTGLNVNYFRWNGRKWK